MKEQIVKWMQEFVEQPNPMLGNWAPCPFARQARVNNSIAFKNCTVPEFMDVIRESMHDLETKEVVVIYFDHNDINPVTLQEWVGEVNNMLMPMNYVILEDHPDAPEYVNGVKMNFGECGLLVLQKLDKLNAASDQLKHKGYYDKWDKHALDEVVNWRTPT